MPRPSAATYELFAVTARDVIQARRVGAPADPWLIEWGLRRRAQFVVRYFPSRRGWLVFDLRKALRVPHHTSRSGKTVFQIVGWARSEKIWPSSAAAVMAAVSIAG